MGLPRLCSRDSHSSAEGQPQGLALDLACAELELEFGSPCKSPSEQPKCRQQGKDSGDSSRILIFSNFTPL